MVNQTENCDLPRLKLLLAGELPDDEQSRLAQHLQECPQCRQELEQLAGDQSWWDEASEFLQPHQHDFKPRDDHALMATHCLLSTDELGPVEFSLDFLEPSDNPAMIGRLGDYEILEMIGRGGMGVVLKGYQRELNRYVAVKVMAPHYASSGAARKRFAREAQAAAAVVHPHVVAIHGIEAKARLPYIVMPYVAAKSLQAHVHNEGPLELKEILRIGKQTAEGLAAAHAQGLVHRDIKPANILLEDDIGRVLLTDFGLARAVDDATMTRSGVIAGTPQYMSPEQAHGRAVDHRADLFSLGSVLYTMCTGHPPFRAETTMGILRRICEEDARPIAEINADLPDWLARLVSKLLEKDPDKRFQSAAEVAELLEQCLAHVQQPNVSLPSTLAWPYKQSPTRWRSTWVILSGIATVMCLTLAIAYYTTRQDNGAEPNRSESSSDNQVTTDIQQPSQHVGSASFAWKDDSAQQIRELDEESAALERDVSKLWHEYNDTDANPDD